MRKITLLFLFVCAVSYGYELNDSSVIRLSEVDVNASRRKQFPEIGKVVKQLDAGAINSMPAQGLDVLLKSISGVDVRQRGTGGTQADISLRGGSFDQVLILLNGVNITDPQTGHHNLNIPLDLSEVSKVEVLQGSASRRYGSQAFSGAINIVTDTKSKSLLDASISYGYYNTQAQKLTFSLGKKALRNFTTVARNRSDGYRTNTDYETYNLFSQTSLETNKSGNLDLQLAWQSKSFGANGFYSLAYPNQFEHTQTQFSSLKWQQQYGDLNVEAQAYHRRHYDRFELFRSFQGAASWYVDHNYHLTDVTAYAINVGNYTPVGKFSGGIDVKVDHIFSTVLGEDIVNVNDRPVNLYEKGQDKYFTKEAERLIASGYLDFSRNIGKLYFSGGASFSKATDFKLQTNYGADISYFHSNDLVLFASANTASRLPTFTDLYYKSATQLANPDLQPEKSLTVELGTKYRRGGLQCDGSVFYRKGTDIIDWVKFPDQEKWQSMNLTVLNTMGADASASYRFSQGFMKQLKLSYAFVNTDKASTTFDSKYALDYLRHQIVFQASHSLVSNVGVTWNLNYNDRAGDYADFDTGAKVPYRPYWLINSRIAWQMKQWMVYADLNNLLNESYVDFGGLTLPGFNALVGVKWRWK
ncbi:MAG: TonB-dependent receptor [Paludibacter sp.]|nr:TonB-dependent receptor [Paludibacter sp.]